MMAELVLEALIWAGLLVIVVLVVLIFKALSSKPALPSGDMALASSGSQSAPSGGDDGDKPQETPSGPPVEESEAQRLVRMEKELAEREAKMKAERVSELTERERILLRRRGEEQAAQGQRQEQTPEERDELTSERGRILELIKKAEERYANGELEEKNFKRIVSNYQQQIIEIDIQLKKRKGG